MRTSGDIDTYIQSLPSEVRTHLTRLRATIGKAAPRAEEAMRYGIPTYRFESKNLVHFGGFKHHVSFFPGPEAIVAFKKELAPYTVSKGTIQFPLDAKLPLTLISRIVKFRLARIEADSRS